MCLPKKEKINIKYYKNKYDYHKDVVYKKKKMNFSCQKDSS